ncbi:helix-turn-helix transcriptional regulator [Actinomycetospora flava]|uniref:LuxR family transcriptional regulator n=1 Tax=Actinomycetospora flava TaxID=3129232 RepID=A0ABU8LYV2_9PSEU
MEGVHGRDAELATLDAAVDRLRLGPVTLVVSGPPGSGVSTLWSAAVRRAREQETGVVTARPTAAETGFPHGVLADLLPGLLDLSDDGTVLPEPQRRAVDAVLLRSAPGPDVDARTVGSALLGLLSRVSGPVLLAVDDADLVDASSAAALAFALRRAAGPVGVLAGLAADAPAPDWVTARGDVERLVLGDLPPSALHRLVVEHTGAALPRPALDRLARISGGRPLYALELARADRDGRGDHLPPTLGALVADRVARLAPATLDALLLVALAGAPTVALLRRAGADPADLLPAEADGVVAIAGERIAFGHPLLAAAVADRAGPGARRDAHRRLGAVTDHPEDRARHRALGSLGAEPVVLADLDAAAASARARGAPDAAAELLELALGLGGDTAARRAGLAGHLLAAGDAARARELLTTLGDRDAAAERLLAHVHLHTDSYAEAAAHLEAALARAGDDAERARVRAELVYVTVNLGRIGEAATLADQLAADAAAVGDDGLLAVAEATRTMTVFLAGGGLDRAALDRALAGEDPTASGAVMTRPSLVHGLLLAWTGELDRARDVLLGLRRDALDTGAEADLLFPAFHHVILECWRGDLAAAEDLARDTAERAEQLGGSVAHAIAASVTATAAAYAGRLDEARAQARRAIALLAEGSAVAATVWPMITLGFAELSAGDLEAAAAVLGPMAAATREMGYGEPLAAPFVPDAVEALVGVGRLAEARPLVDALQEAGRTLDRPWALALGGRCRGLLRAADGDLDGAAAALTDALHEHDRLPVPVERARTRLALAAVERRRRRRRVATEHAEAAAAVFARIGCATWAARARTEAGRLHPVPEPHGDGLTPAEHRMALLAAAGRTNRSVAAELAVSPKTVEATLARAYRKLGIRSRAELGALMARLERETPDVGGARRS